MKRKYPEQSDFAIGRRISVPAESINMSVQPKRPVTVIPKPTVTIKRRKK